MPVFKSGDNSLVKNYRPISLMCIVSKVLEKIVFQNLFDFLYNRSSVYQFDFVPGRSCLQQLLSFTHELAIYLAKSLHCDAAVIYLDYTEKLSTPWCIMNYCIILWQYGISGDLWNWIRPYLTNWILLQCVCVDGQVSNLLPVVSGVPQGSLLHGSIVLHNFY